MDIREVFQYHKPDEDDERKYEHIRAAGKNLAQAILAYAPRCADQSAAIRKVREAVMTANAAIALKGAV